MEPFIARFLSEVDDNLADPHSQKRLTVPMRLRDLYTVQQHIFERLLNATGQESSLGRTESLITVVEDQAFYGLPYGFRKFLGFERRMDGNPNLVDLQLYTIASHEPGPGVEILDQQRGMMIRPKPDRSATGDWTLIWRKGPIKLHYAKAASIAPRSIMASRPGDEAGELVHLPEYYTGALIRVFDAEIGAGQVRPCIKSGLDGEGRVVFFFDRDFDPLPTGEVWYEVCPEVPEGYDSIYAMDVALKNCSRRSKIRLKSGLREDRAENWDACRSYFLSNTADRPPTRMRSQRDWQMDPYMNS